MHGFSILFFLILIPGFPWINKSMASGTSDDSIEMLFVRANGKQKQIELLLSATKQLKSIDPDRALRYASRAYSLADSSKFPKLRLQSMIDIGNIQALKTKLTAGMEMALRAKELAIRLDDKKALAEACLIIGMIQIFQGNFSDSYESDFMALSLFGEINDKDGIVKALNGIGNICYHQQDFNKAYIYYSNALKMARDIHDTLQIANVLNNVGLVLVERGQPEKAIDYYQEAIDIHNRLGFKVRTATNYINLAEVFLQLNRYDDFLKNYNAAVEIYASIGSTYNLALCHMISYNYYKKIKEPDNALKIAMLAFSEGWVNKLREVVSQASGVLHDYYLSAGRIDSAYKYAMILNAEKDSINNEHSSAKLTLLEMEYSYDKNQKEEKFRQQRKDFITVILIILFISGLITTLLFLSRQIVKTKNMRLEKQRLSDEIEFKNKELTLNVMNLIKKNEMLVDLTNRLIQMQQNVKDPSTKQEFIQLINSLQRTSSSEIWEEFEMRFRQVHNSFYEKLLSRFPELTPSELKLAALLRLNLSTKEICELSGQRPASLDVARSRLRKKLGLANSQINLVTFLSQI